MNSKKSSVKNKIFWCLVLSICLAGCGLKANPVPSTPRESLFKAQIKLAASVENNAVILTWRIDQPDRSIRYIKIEKSSLGETAKVCKGCPRTYDKLSLIEADSDNNRFVDAEIVRGHRYAYRIAMCSEAAVCREFKVVEIDVQ